MNLFGFETFDNSGNAINDNFINDKYFIDLITVTESGSKTYSNIGIGNYGLEAVIYGFNVKGKPNLIDNTVFVDGNTVNWKIAANSTNEMTIMVMLNVQ